MRSDKYLNFYGAEQKKIHLLKWKVVSFQKKVVGTPGLNDEWKTLHGNVDDKAEKVIALYHPKIYLNVYIS